MRTPFHLAVAITVVLLTTSACASSGDGQGASPAPGSSTPTTPTATGQSPSPGGTAAPSISGGGAALPDDLRTRPAVAAAIADTAQKAGANPAEVVIAAWSPVTFTDGSMACPKKGMSYTQSLVEGELLLLRVDTSLFQYHAATGGPFAYCANPTSAYTVGG